MDTTTYLSTPPPIRHRQQRIHCQRKLGCVPWGWGRSSTLAETSAERRWQAGWAEHRFLRNLGFTTAETDNPILGISSHARSNMSSRPDFNVRPSWRHQTSSSPAQEHHLSFSVCTFLRQSDKPAACPEMYSSRSRHSRRWQAWLLAAAAQAGTVSGTARAKRTSSRRESLRE